MTTTKRCPKCGSEYLHSVEECIDCEVALVDADTYDDPDEGGDRDDDVVPGRGITLGDQVRYELHEWSGESRMMLEQLMAGAEIARAWEGSTVVIDQSDEAQVDELIEHVEGSAEAPLDPDAERVVYEVGDWTADQLTVLIDALVEAGIPHEFDIEGDVAVLADDEDRVEALLDSLDFEDPDSAAAEGEDVDADDGLETAAVLSDLFVACDRLQKDASDHEGVLGLVDAATRLERRPLPFGFTPSAWKGLVGAAVDLRAEIEDDTVMDEDIEDHARDLRTLLRQYV